MVCTCFLSQIEPKKVTQALQDPSWIEAMQDELLQFSLQKVWRLVDLPKGKHAIGTKWVHRNKKDERRLVVRNKARLVAQDKGDILLVQVYVDDIIFGSTKKSLCVEFESLMHKKFQMSSMGELTFFLGLQVMQRDDGIFISQDKYVADILKKFDFVTMKTTSTPIETHKALLKDEEAEDVDVHLYRSMIGSLMYLTASRPDIMFVVCACARFQVTPKVSHLHAVKRIFRYLKGQPKLGLWYPRDSPFDLEAFSDSDYAGASLDRKSTTGGCQFLGKRLISWQCKKQTIVANSTTEAEYVAAANCCRQVLWIQNQMLDYGFNFMNTKIYIDNESTICIVKNPVFHSKTKHIEIRHHFIRDSYEKRLIQVIKIHTDHNVADLLTKAFDVSSTSENGEMEITATIDGRVKTVTEASIRRHLKLEDSDGISTLPNTEIFEQLALMGAKKTAWDQFSSNIATAIICLATNRTFNFSKLIFDGMGEGSTVPVESQHIPTDASSTSPPHISPTLRSPIRQEIEVPQLSSPPHTNVADKAASISVDVRHGGAATTVNSLDAGQGSTLETDLRQTKKVFGDAFTRLIKKVKKLEKTVKTSQARRRSRVVISDEEEDAEDHVTPIKVSAQGEAHTQQDQLEDHLRLYSAAKRTVSTSSGEINTAEELVSTTGASMPVSTTEVALKLQEEFDAAERQRMAQVHQAAQGFTNAEWDDVLARVAADKDFVQQLQAAEAKGNKPMNPAQQKDYMSNYIKNQEGGYSIKQLKSLSFDQVKEIFEATMRRVQSFVPMDSELEVQRLKRSGQEVSKKPVKRQKIGEASGSGEKHSAEKEKALSQEDLQQMMMVVPVEEVYVEALHVRYLIIDWEIYFEDTRRYWRIIRFGNHTEAYQTFDDMLKKFD
ncbi:putative ribonuclease H-like domain-containing protein [Tanacetum coccineum]|uniref:Ribonuclease H-like domain-containing protein n=1 Tax=Tanacetum coccineum TaxID=301880 RepID=A0ABQ4YUE9_9ASTR